ncbi:hypothetical protein KO507_12845 [Gilvimarinus agarilyticus]|uniref:hypothetical protein n=1 Tax=Gilvimarinus sp. 2_MG-2023 TaxID=3062666 RepID=UPI001C08EB44|nr:hypothetical protein [Gilvimarinus sp. 2_MG-2023]MBU2886653.1 hypothetical protein [Gilvimarinus agarilyticus]MDO6571321.1 hypothetical protein [Gilvimarinus sp. 2_MG-2023]
MTLTRIITALIFVLTLSACNQNDSPDTTMQAAPLTSSTSSVATSVCKADINWITNPNPPNEIPGGGSNFCQFYQFSWQWFFYLMSPSQTDPSLRNFQVTSEYPVLEIDGNSCASSATEPVFFVRTVKDEASDTAFTLPERIGQAGGGATIYDQDGNVVFYSIAFSRSLCTAPAQGDLPDDTTELKLAWRVISDAEKSDYFWIEADVIPEQGAPVGETLGLIGMHLVRGTAEHHELVWASFEHRNNAPNCQSPAQAPQGGWSFTSSQCESCLNNPTASCLESCAFNKASPASSLSGAASEICRVFPEGTAKGDHKAGENLADVTALNHQVRDLLAGVNTPQSMQVLAQYFNIGALWVSDPSQASTTDNQRGSMQLANPVMETTFQGSLSIDGGKISTSTNGVLNCFTCHGYQPGETATTGLSHIFDDIQKQQAATAQ